MLEPSVVIGTAATGRGEMADERAVVEATLDAWHRRDAAGVAAQYAPDAVLHEHITGRTAVGGEAIAQVHLGWIPTFPDVRGEDLRWFQDGELVGYQVTWRGRQTGDLPVPDGTVVPATGRSIEIPAVNLHVVQGGRIVRQDHYFNAMTMLVQLGAVPAPAAA